MKNVKYFALLAIVLVQMTAKSQFKFHEYSCSNIGSIYDHHAGRTYFASPDWVEIINTSSSTTPATFSYWYLSDDRTNLRKYQIPIVNNKLIKLNSHQVYVILLCGHNRADSGIAGSPDTLHANFSLNQTKPGTTLYLTANIPPYSVATDSVVIKRSQPDHSWGIPDSTGTIFNKVWKLYRKPSPWLSNPYQPVSGTPSYFAGYAPSPKISLQPGFYGGTQTFNILDSTNNINPNLELFYTNDCSKPALNGNSPLTPSTIDLGATSSGGTGASTQTNYQSGSGCFSVRAIVHDNGIGILQEYLDSFESYSSFLVDSTYYKLCVTCVCVDTNLLFLTQTKDTVPMLLTCFNTSKKEVVKNIGQGMLKKLHFHNFNGLPNKQWQFWFRSEDEYGYNYTNNYAFFTDQSLGLSNRTDFPELIFRAGGEDNYLLGGSNLPTKMGANHVRDFFNHTISLRHDLNFEASHTKPTYLFMNGAFRGIYYIKEPVDSAYTNYYYNYPHAAILANDILQSTTSSYTTLQQDTVAGKGTGFNNAAYTWNKFYTWAMMPGTNVHIPALYNMMADSLDFSSLNDYVIYNMLSVNSDFVNRYASWWKGLPTNAQDTRTSKWRFALTNTDLTWGFEIKNPGNISNITVTSQPCNYTMTPVHNSNYPIMPLWTKLMSNDTFRSSFLGRYCDLLNTALSCDSLENHLSYVKSLFTPGDMRSHVWWMVANPTGCSGCDSVHYWTAMLDSMNSFIAYRCTLALQGIQNCYNLLGPYNVCVDVSPPGDGKVVFNNITLQNYVWNGGYFDNILCNAVAIPDSNYVFDHWETTPNNYAILPGSKSDTIHFYVNQQMCITAFFKIKDPSQTYGIPTAPTGFSPNGDGVNDVFNIYGIANASSYEMAVYNRWGETLFQSNDKNLGWDGTFSGAPVPVGVYAFRYKVEVNGKSYSSKGSITLLR